MNKQEEIKHKKDCVWMSSDCEYKETHHYCPHPEHLCDCHKQEEQKNKECKNCTIKDNGQTLQLDNKGCCAICGKQIIIDNTADITRPKTEDKWEEMVNDFIKKWCGENTTHLLDDDENDGERLRQALSQREEEIREKIEKKREEYKNTDVQHDFLKELALDVIDDILNILNKSKVEDKN